MANVNIKFNGKEFLLSCDDGQEEHLEELSIKLSNKFESLKNKLGNIGENKLLLITSISIIDEYFETRKNVDKTKIELENLKIKFKELRSLVYNYKDEKENQIKQLDLEQKKLKEQIELNLSSYNKILDTTTNEIENFIKETDNKSLV